MNLRSIFKFATVFFFLSPAVLLGLYFFSFKSPDLVELTWAIKNTLIQAFFSALFALILGFLSVPGKLWLDSQLPSEKLRWIFEVFILLPNIIPTIFVLLSCLNLIPNFPFGLLGVILIHTVLNVGLVTVALSRLIEEKLGGMTELAYIEGASSFSFYYQGIVRLLYKEFFLLFFLVFSLCFTSFAVPLVIGGNSGTTIEVLIYEKIRIYGDWPQAISLSFIQVVFVFVISVVLLRANSTVEVVEQKVKQLALLHNRWTWLIPIVISLFIIVGQFVGVWAGYQQLIELPTMVEVLSTAIWGTLFLSVGTGVLTMAMLLLIAWLSPSQTLKIFFRGYMTPSSVLTGFALLLWGPNSGGMEYLKIVIGLTLIIVPSLYRMSWEAKLEGLQGQVAVARTLGAPWGMILWEIIWPQVIETMSYLGALSAFWAAGDFALSGILSGKSISLSLLLRELMSHYRLQAATFLSWILLILGVAVFVLFMSLRSFGPERDDSV